ncbi:MAG: hypothetical protein ACK559_20715, partial [bacterium]
MARERKDIVAAEIAENPDAVHFLISVRDEKAIAGGYACGTWGWAIFACILFASGVVIAERNGRFLQETSIAIYVGAALIFLFVYAIAWSITVFNSVLRLRQRTRRAWSNIDVELKRRHDLIP